MDLAPSCWLPCCTHASWMDLHTVQHDARYIIFAFKELLRVVIHAHPCPQSCPSLHDVCPPSITKKHKVRPLYDGSDHISHGHQSGVHSLHIAIPSPTLSTLLWLLKQLHQVVIQNVCITTRSPMPSSPLLRNNQCKQLLHERPVSII